MEQLLDYGRDNSCTYFCWKKKKLVYRIIHRANVIQIM